MSIYVGVNPDDLHRLRPLLSLFFQQAIGLQTQALPEHDPMLRCQLLLLLDEFAALGRIPIISEAASYLPGYNVRLVLIFQALSQLREVYGPHAAATMLKSLAARIVFAPKDYDEAKEISEELGDSTVRGRAVSHPRFAQWGRRRGGGQAGQVTVSDQRRPLLLPQEVKELGNEEALIFYEGLRPIRCRKLRYYRDRRFKRRLMPPPAQPIAPDATLRSPAKDAPVVASKESPERRPAEPQPAEGQAAQSELNAEGRKEASPREPTLDDLPRLGSLTLADFAGNYGHIPVVEDRTATAAEIEQAVEEFLADLNVSCEP